MAAGRLVISCQAGRDLDDLFDYIAADASVDRAEAILRRIGDTLSNLAFTPMIGRVRPDLEGQPRFLRCLAVADLVRAAAGAIRRVGLAGDRRSA